MGVLRPHNHIIEFTLCNQHLVKASEILILLVHDSKAPHSVALDLLDWITEQSQTLQLLEVLELLDIIDTSDVVAVQVKSFKAFEVLELVLDFSQVVV